MPSRLRPWFSLLWMVAVLALAAAASAQVSIPTFGTREGVSDTLRDDFMSALRAAVAERSGLKVTPGDLITPGIAGSLEPEFTALIAELDNARYALSGELRPDPSVGRGGFVANVIVVDAVDDRATDLLSLPFARDTLRSVADDLALLVADFVAQAVTLASGNAGLWVTSEPMDARVYLDGVLVGETGDLEPLMLVPGRYLLEVRKEGFLPETRTVELRQDDTSFVRVILTAIAGGSIQVTSRPAATVLLDGVRLGTTPLTISALPGSHTLRLERPGFTPRVFTVPVRNYRVTRVTETLRPSREPLLFWDLQRTTLVSIDGVLQPGSYSTALPSGLATITLRGPRGAREVRRVMPANGAWELDLDTGDLLPLDPP